MRKNLFSSLFVFIPIFMVLVMRASLPNYSGMLPGFFIFMLFEGYLWHSARETVNRLNPILRASCMAVFWLPLALLPGMLVYGWYVPYITWNQPVRTYLQSFILVLFMAELFPMLTLIAADLVRLVRIIINAVIPGRKISVRNIRRFKPLLRTGWIMGFLVFCLMIAGMVFWQFDFRVRKQVIVLKELPPAFDGFKIVQFSDVHLGSWGCKRELQKAMDEINSLNPDVIFFTGDMFNYCTADGYGFEPELKTLHAPFGIYAIMGNHDYGDYINWSSPAAKKKNVEDLKLFYKNLGWKLLLNSNSLLKRGHDSIAVIGVENWGATKRFQRFGDIARAMHGTEGMAIQLLLSHDPSHWDSIVSKRYQNIDVTFAGHTHGGQAGIDCCGIHWSPVQWVSRFWCGLYRNPASPAPQYLYVNQGLGNIGYSGRIGILPEITLITLKRNLIDHNSTSKSE